MRWVRFDMRTHTRPHQQPHPAGVAAGGGVRGGSRVRTRRGRPPPAGVVGRRSAASRTRTPRCPQLFQTPGVTERTEQPWCGRQAGHSGGAAQSSAVTASAARACGPAPCRAPARAGTDTPEHTRPSTHARAWVPQRRWPIGVHPGGVPPSEIREHARIPRPRPRCCRGARRQRVRVPSPPLRHVPPTSPRFSPSSFSPFRPPSTVP